MSSQDFRKFLEEQKIKFDYKLYDFLYDHDGPCPQVARDHPLGLAPEVLNIPQQEWDDWNTYVYDYYTNRGVSFARDLANFSFAGGLAGYIDISDPDFALLLGEGLYSKFLCPLVKYPKERQDRWGPLDGQREYFVSDYSCMRVITVPWPNEYVAPTVVLLSRPKGDYTTLESYGTDPTKTVYRVDFIDLCYMDDNKQWQWLDAPLTREKDSKTDAWWVAKYFVLQGAIHRINLIDHIKVHFPSDAINAITKTALPKRNLVFQLLMPHFWLQLPVNNSVLEGDRSLINRETWYPWSPFVAAGEEVRKLMPFAWYGSRYYAAQDPYFDTDNPSYPGYEFQLDPPDIPSRYGLFFKDYFINVQTFVSKVVQEIPGIDNKVLNTDYVEIIDWATQIASWIPSFPDWDDISDPKNGRDKLTNALSMIILNNAVIHSADHGTLHKMMITKPVPYILRIPPPHDLKYTRPIIRAVADLPKILRDRIPSQYVQIVNFYLVSHSFTLLCYPTDLMSAGMTDLLFYLPHNCSLLIDCDYQFTQDGQKQLTDEINSVAREWEDAASHQYDLNAPRLDPVAERFFKKIDGLQRQLLEPPQPLKLKYGLEPPVPPAPRYQAGIGQRLQQAVKQFQDELRKVSDKYKNEIENFGFPMVEAPLPTPPVLESASRTPPLGEGNTPVPPGNLSVTPPDQGPPAVGGEGTEQIKRTKCIGAGIQY
jgi:hypothetical protein